MAFTPFQWAFTGFYGFSHDFEFCVLMDVAVKSPYRPEKHAFLGWNRGRLELMTLASKWAKISAGTLIFCVFRTKNRPLNCPLRLHAENYLVLSHDFLS